MSSGSALDLANEQLSENAKTLINRNKEIHDLKQKNTELINKINTLENRIKNLELQLKNEKLLSKDLKENNNTCNSNLKKIQQKHNENIQKVVTLTTSSGYNKFKNIKF